VKWVVEGGESLKFVTAHSSHGAYEYSQTSNKLIRKVAQNIKMDLQPLIYDMIFYTVFLGLGVWVVTNIEYRRELGFWSFNNILFST